VTRAEFQALMARTFGPDWEAKVITTPAGSFALVDGYAECGFDPPTPPVRGDYGLYQINTGPRLPTPLDPIANVRAAHELWRR
jgi:hypothetical protein